MVAFIDFEASTLASGSYPIEVGWAVPWGGSGSALIRPEWNWTAWSPVSERHFHKISRSDLERNGVRAAEALARLVEAVRGHAVYAADPAFDGYWLDQVATAAGEATPFVVGDAGKLFEATAAERGVSLDAVRVEAERRRPHVHRAEADAKLLAEVWVCLHAANPLPKSR